MENMENTMTEWVKYSPETLGWQRSPGPPKIWRVVEGRKKTDDGKTLKFSIQEIPEDRYEDVMDHMTNIWLRDEALSSYLGVRDDEDAVNDFRKSWIFALQQGVVLGAFLVEENNPKPFLAGVSMTVIWTEAAEGCLKLIEMASEKYLRMVGHFIDVEKDVDTRERYNVDKYVMGFGLSVDPLYRGQGLAYQLLRAREDIGMAYGVQATSSVFTSPAAVKGATQAGWEIIVVRDFKDSKNEDGSEKFPGITAKGCTLMGKRFTPRK